MYQSVLELSLSSLLPSPRLRFCSLFEYHPKDAKNMALPPPLTLFFLFTSPLLLLLTLLLILLILLLLRMILFRIDWYLPPPLRESDSDAPLENCMPLDIVALQVLIPMIIYKKRSGILSGSYCCTASCTVRMHASFTPVLYMVV